MHDTRSEAKIEIRESGWKVEDDRFDFELEAASRCELTSDLACEIWNEAEAAYRMTDVVRALAAHRAIGDDEPKVDFEDVSRMLLEVVSPLWRIIGRAKAIVAVSSEAEPQPDQADLPAVTADDFARVGAALIAVDDARAREAFAILRQILDGCAKLLTRDMAREASVVEALKQAGVAIAARGERVAEGETRLRTAEELLGEPLQTERLRDGQELTAAEKLDRLDRTIRDRLGPVGEELLREAGR